MLMLQHMLQPTPWLAIRIAPSDKHACTRHHYPCPAPPATLQGMLGTGPAQEASLFGDCGAPGCHAVDALLTLPAASVSMCLCASSITYEALCTTNATDQ